MTALIAPGASSSIPLYLDGVFARPIQPESINAALKAALDAGEVPLYVGEDWSEETRSVVLFVGKFVGGKLVRETRGYPLLEDPPVSQAEIEAWQKKNWEWEVAP